MNEKNSEYSQKNIRMNNFIEDDYNRSNSSINSFEEEEEEKKNTIKKEKPKNKNLIIEKEEEEEEEFEENEYFISIDVEISNESLSIDNNNKLGIIKDISNNNYYPEKKSEDFREYSNGPILENNNKIKKETLSEINSSLYVSSNQSKCCNIY